MLSIILFILILSFLVMLHEFGHFLFAKRAKIGVEEFGWGLPPRIWGKKYKGTIYSINWLPFGGFVRLVGEDATGEKRFAKNSFQVKSLSQRIKVVLAGVIFNFILAVVIFYGIVFALGFKVSLPLVIEHKFRFVDQTSQVLIAEVALDSQAAKAGIKEGESIISVNGTKVSTTKDLQKIIRENQNKPVQIILENPVDNSKRTAEVTPKYNDSIGAPAIGVGMGELAVLNYKTPLQKLFSGFIHSYNTTAYSFSVFGKLIGISVESGDIGAVSEGVSGPVGIARITQQAVALGPLSVLQLVALLSLNLAVMNVLPIPALDGGRFFFLVIEAITRKKPNATLEKYVHSAGFAVLIGLILLITYNDILKIVR